MVGRGTVRFGSDKTPLGYCVKVDGSRARVEVGSPGGKGRNLEEGKREWVEPDGNN